MAGGGTAAEGGGFGLTMEGTGTTAEGGGFGLPGPVAMDVSRRSGITFASVESHIPTKFTEFTKFVVTESPWPE
eukprot:9677585-Heterocapsa_arctica.AAC.1